LRAIGAGDRGNLGDELLHLVLPSFAIGLGWVGYLARLVRASMLEVLGENHIRTARAYGLAERRIVFRYALRLAVLPTVALLGVGIGNLLSGAVFAEIVFARPGAGKLVFDAVVTRNFPVASGAVLVTTALFALCTLAADLLIPWLAPRVRPSLGGDGAGAGTRLGASAFAVGLAGAIRPGACRGDSAHRDLREHHRPLQSRRDRRTGPASAALARAPLRHRPARTRRVL